MNLFGLMQTSGSAMQAERMRAEVVAANMANAETTRTQAGVPYRRQHVVFAAGEGDTGFASHLGASLPDVAIGSFADAASAPLSGSAPGSVPGSLLGSGNVAPGVHIAA